MHCFCVTARNYDYGRQGHEDDDAYGGSDGYAYGSGYGEFTGYGGYSYGGRNDDDDDGEGAGYSKFSNLSIF